MQNEYRKVTFQFPAKDYVYLKMACVKQNKSMKDIITKAVTMYLEDLEDELDDSMIGQARKEISESGVITWQELEQKLGWDKL